MASDPTKNQPTERSSETRKPENLPDSGRLGGSSHREFLKSLRPGDKLTITLPSDKKKESLSPPEKGQKKNRP